MHTFYGQLDSKLNYILMVPPSIEMIIFQNWIFLFQDYCGKKSKRILSVLNCDKKIGCHSI